MAEVDETLMLLQEAAQEIRMLRRVNEVLQAKVSMIELFDRVLNSRPPSVTSGFGEDVAWKLDKHADALRLAKPLIAPAPHG
ncbi:MAG: hypothetical protein WA210_09100 [Burkholderiaceae bacterium]